MIACLTSFVCFQLVISNSEAQEIRNAIRDYKTDRVLNYQPSDPWNRGKLFNIHTKNYGKFYNCDGEESKRNSPYICWKPHTDKDFPTHVRMIDCIRNDLSEVRQRIKDGAGACLEDNCNCSQCQSYQQPQSNGCAQCADAARQSTQSRVAQRASVSPLVANSQEPNGKFGLVQGKILSNSKSSRQAVFAQEAASKTTVAKKPGTKSLLDRLR